MRKTTLLLSLLFTIAFDVRGYAGWISFGAGVGSSVPTSAQVVSAISGQAIAPSSVNMGAMYQLTPQSSAPGSPTVGAVYKADGINWDPITHATTMTASTISFSSSTNRISNSANDMTVFKVGQSINVTGSASNNATYIIDAVAAGYVHVTTALVTESAGASDTLVADYPYIVQYAQSGSWFGVYDDSGLLLVSNVYASGSVPEDIASFSWGNQGAGTAIPTTWGWVCKRTKYAATLTGYSLTSTQSCTATIKLVMGTYSTSGIPSIDITGGNYITTSAAYGKRSEDDTNFSGWTTTIPANTEICADLTTNDLSQSMTVTLHGTR